MACDGPCPDADQCPTRTVKPACRQTGRFRVSRHLRHLSPHIRTNGLIAGSAAPTPGRIRPCPAADILTRPALRFRAAPTHPPRVADRDKTDHTAPRIPSRIRVLVEIIVLFRTVTSC